MDAGEPLSRVVENRSCLDADGSSDDFVLSRRALALEIAAGWPAAAEINLRYTLSYALANEDIIKGYQVDKDQYLEISKDELENIALESTRTIKIDEFVPRSEIDTGAAGTTHFEPGGVACWDSQNQNRNEPAAS
jgi:hypothetical protein